MENTREEILPHVYLRCLQTDKFKTGCMSVTLLTQLDRENASANALIPYVLRRGTTTSPDMRALAVRLGELYGASVEPVVRKRGEIQCVGFRADFCDDRFLPEQTDLVRETARLLSELFLSPVTRGGLFLPAYTETERDKLIERIEASVNDKRRYALRRLLECMCPCENYAVDRLGSREAAENINYVKLSKHYKSLLADAPVELFYCGSADPQRVKASVTEAFLTMPRGEPDPELGTDIRMNAMEEKPRTFTEEMDVTQGKLTVGFRLGSCMEDPDLAVLRVFDAVYGGTATSKLFMNVREKLSLCYYASSMVDMHKGILAVTSGIEFDKYNAALSEILAQLDVMRRGEITEQELSTAKGYIASRLRAVNDSPGALEDFYLDQSVDGLDYGPDELAALVEDVTQEELVSVAQGVECDAVYFLKGTEEKTDA